MADTAPSAPAAVTPTDLAQMDVGQINAALMDGRISGFQREPYVARLETLLRATDAPPPSAPPPSAPTISRRYELQTGTQLPQSPEQLAKTAALEAAAYKPAISSEEFVSTLRPDAKPEHIEFDADLRAALHRAQLPASVGNSLIKAFQQNARALNDATQEQLRVYLSRSNEQLQTAWGEQFSARIRTISDFIDQMAAKSPAVRQILANTPHLLADPVGMQLLWSVLERRGRS